MFLKVFWERFFAPMTGKTHTTMPYFKVFFLLCSFKKVSLKSLKEICSNFCHVTDTVSVAGIYLHDTNTLHRMWIQVLNWLLLLMCLHFCV